MDWPLPFLKELAPPRYTDRDSALCGSPVEAGHVCGCDAFFSILSLSEAQEFIGLVLVFYLEIGSSAGYTHIRYV